MKESSKICIRIALVFLLISILIAPLRGGYITIGSITGFKLSSIVGFIIIYFVSLWFLIKFHGKLPVGLIILSIFLGISLIILPIHIFDFTRTLGSLLEYLIHLLAILMAFICYKSSKYARVIITILSLGGALWLSISGYGLWVNKQNFKTYTGRINDNRTWNFHLQTANGDTVSIESFRGKIVIVDCWYTYCGYCFKAFPKVQAIYDKYKDNPGIQLIGLHCRIEDDNHKPTEKSSKGKELLIEKGYTFPCYSINMKDKVLVDLGVSKFPTILVFNKDGRLIYRGDIEYVDNVIGQ